MGFRSRLVLCFSIPALLFAAALGMGLWGLLRIQADFDRHMASAQKLSDSLSEMYAQGLQSGQALRNIVLDSANKQADGNLSASQKEYDRAYAEALKIASGTPYDQEVRSLEPLAARQNETIQKVVVLARQDVAQAISVLNTEQTPAWRQLRAALLKQRDAARKSAEDSHLSSQDRGRQVMVAASLLTGLALLVATMLGIVMLRSLRAELGGEPSAACDAMRRIAAGDLASPVQVSPGSAGSLMAELASMQSQLRQIVGEVQESSGSIQSASSEVATGNSDLSNRTEQAASNLQQTAASMEELTSTLAQSASAASTANQLAVAAASVAQRGGSVVQQVVSTMEEIRHSSQKIAEIIGLIDSIAFQTNILALNAAVEAARAGEQGRGFAVVASEVRSLAGRSAEAARQIKQLIGDSNEKVSFGSGLVNDAGSTMREIVADVQRVADMIGEINAAASEQNQGISQVNVAVGMLDQMTQQNAALVEESTAAAHNLSDQAQRLAALAGRFRLAP
ncbi:Methyl-accepting chemotaxis protein [Paracidovorax anthurii]|uniref:Methyl-accepting chemotaxis protein n=3 Tax=Paracidovorax anthurii TaxID=78229 RepID=A0A328YI20_9BURK|nr:methyl-accepting chemotaxis protein [Paracidovorax anthurii]